MRRRVVVSGIGMVTPIGTGREAFARALFGGESGIAPITSFDTGRFVSKLGAEVTDFSAAAHISLKNLRKMDRLSRLATAAARLAVDDAGVIVDDDNRSRMGIILGTAFGGTEVAVQFMQVIFRDGPQMANPILVPNTVMNAPAGHASIEIGFTGINSTINHHEASAETAIAYAAAEIESGRADIMLAGGAEIISEFYFEVLSRFKALAPQDGGEESARPFDVARNGPVVGEGAGILCLEAIDSAQRRGVTPYCEITGWGLSAAPAPLNGWPSDPLGPILAIQRAMASANIAPDAIDHVSAAANGGVILDRLEADALARVFGPNGSQPQITALKGALGESYSSGGIRASAMALSISSGMIPPTLGLSRPLAPLAFVVQPQTRTVSYGFLNGFSSGGTFASLVFKTVD